MKCYNNVQKIKSLSQGKHKTFITETRIEIKIPQAMFCWRNWSTPDPKHCVQEDVSLWTSIQSAFPLHSCSHIDPRNYLLGSRHAACSCLFIGVHCSTLPKSLMYYHSSTAGHMCLPFGSSEPDCMTGQRILQQSLCYLLQCSRMCWIPKGPKTKVFQYSIYKWQLVFSLININNFKGVIVACS